MKTKFEPLANAQTGFVAVVLTIALLVFRANGMKATLLDCFIPLFVALALGVVDFVRLAIAQRKE